MVVQWEFHFNVILFSLRISPRRREYRPNPEEPEEEDEDIQAERVKTANALTTSNLDEVKTSGWASDEALRLVSLSCRVGRVLVLVWKLAIASVILPFVVHTQVITFWRIYPVITLNCLFFCFFWWILIFIHQSSSRILIFLISF